MDLGADRRGVDMGPYAIRYAGLEHDLEAMGCASPSTTT
jgi:arginase